MGKPHDTSATAQSADVFHGGTPAPTPDPGRGEGEGRVIPSGLDGQAETIQQQLYAARALVRKAAEDAHALLGDLRGYRFDLEGSRSPLPMHVETLPPQAWKGCDRAYDDIRFALDALTSLRRVLRKDAAFQPTDRSTVEQAADEPGINPPRLIPPPFEIHLSCTSCPNRDSLKDSDGSIASKIVEDPGRWSIDCSAECGGRMDCVGITRWPDYVPPGSRSTVEQEGGNSDG